MALRPDLPKIPADREPTIWNGKMARWAFWGSIATTAAAIMLGYGTDTAKQILGAMDNMGITPKTIDSLPMQKLSEFTEYVLPKLAVFEIPSLVGTAVWGLIGGLSGKKELEAEKAEGKTVREPTFWNGRILSNYLSISLPLTIAMTASLAFGSSTAFGLVVLAAPIVSIAAFASAVYGGFSLKNEMQKEFNQAVHIKQSQEQGKFRTLEQTIDRSISRGISQEQSPYINSLTAQESQLLAERLRDSSAPRSFAQEIATRREAVTQVPAEKLA